MIRYMSLIAISLSILSLTASATAQAKLPTSDQPYSIRDCEVCPEMVHMAAGSFTMGRPVGEDPSLPDNETPQRQVTIATPFAISRTEITLLQFLIFVKETVRKPGKSCYGWNEVGNGMVA